MTTRPRLLLDDPHTFLSWLSTVRERGRVSFDDVEVAQVFSIAAVAALARRDGSEIMDVEPASATGAGRFAHALGFDEVIAGETERQPTELDRTVTLTRVLGFRSAESTATKIVKLLFPSKSGKDAADLFWFVLVELLRNVAQHSQDPAGGIVAAQLNDAGPYQGSPAVQIVVVDNGIGVYEALRQTRPSVQTPDAALMHALDPHVSGTFPEGQTGTVENAGLGLYFIDEMARRTRGCLLLASRGATYFVDRSDSENTRPVITDGTKPDYPGTLVAFETALHQVGSYEAIIRDINETAKQRTPKRITYRWLRFEEPPAGIPRVLVDVAAEDTTAAHAFSSGNLEPRLLRRESVALDFRNIRVSTQSFLHALLHETVRLAWARKVPMFVVNVTPAVRTQLELVEGYSLGG